MSAGKINIQIKDKNRILCSETTKWSFLWKMKRPYLMEGLNLMIPTFAKTADFGKNSGF